MPLIKLGKVPQHENAKYKIELEDGIPKPPILGLFVGKRGQGKSTACARLLRYYVDQTPEPVFHKDLIFVISPTAESQMHLWNHIGMDKNNVYVGTSATEVKSQIESIVNIIRKAKERYDDDEEYIEAYNALMRGDVLTVRQENLLDQRDAMPCDNPAPYPRPFLILDDLSHMKVLDKPWFVSLCLRHRHVANGVGLSMAIICQSLHGGVSRVVRQNSSLIVLFCTHDQTAKDDLYAECSHLLDKEEFLSVFEDATQEYHSFLSVDLSQKDPNFAFSRDFVHWYQIRHSNNVSHDSITVRAHGNKEEQTVTTKTF